MISEDVFTSFMSVCSRTDNKIALHGKLSERSNGSASGSRISQFYSKRLDLGRSPITFEP